MPYILELRWLKDHIPTKQGFLHTIRWKRVSWKYSRHGSILGRPLGLALSDHPLDAPSSTKQGRLRIESLKLKIENYYSPLHTTKTSMKKCPVDISTVRLSESAEQNTFDFLSTYPNKTRMKKKSAFWTNWNKKMYRQSGTFKLVSESGWRVFDTLPPSHCHHCCVSSTRIIIAVY